jgi:hypothetical protein
MTNMDESRRVGTFVIKPELLTGNDVRAGEIPRGGGYVRDRMLIDLRDGPHDYHCRQCVSINSGRKERTSLQDGTHP